MRNDFWHSRGHDPEMWKMGRICIKNIFFVSNHCTLTNNPSKCSSWWELWYDKWFMQISIIIRPSVVKRLQNFGYSCYLDRLQTMNTFHHIWEGRCIKSTLEQIWYFFVQIKILLFSHYGQYRAPLYTWVAKFLNSLSAWKWSMNWPIHWNYKSCLKCES